MDEIGLVFSQVERLQQIRRLEELTGLMCRSHFRLLMRLPDCYTLGSKILNSDARARTIREPPRPAMVPVQRFAPAGKRRRRGLTSEQFRFASMTPPAGLWQAERADGGHSQAGGRLMSDMGRREFIAVLGGAAAAWPRAARAQQAGKVHRIGFLGSATSAGSAKEVESLRTGLREFGYVEGTNIGIEFRWAEGIYDRLPHLVAELIATNVDVLITHGTPGTRVAKQATTTIPIVMAISGDAIATGLVSSLARPEANLTGSTFFLPQLNAKRLELLKEACPRISHPAALSNPDNPVSRPIIPAMQAVAAPLSLIVEVVRAQSPSEFSLAFAAMAKSRVDSVVVTEDGEFAASFREIATLALANKLPSIGAREYAEAGGLIGYGVNILGLYRRAAYFVDRILKGVKPADLPIEQPTKFELIVNLKTAKTLGLAIAETFLVRADGVIE